MLGDEAIKNAIKKAIEQGMLGYVPSMTIVSSTPVVENLSLISFEKSISSDELDLAGYLLSPSLVNKLRIIPSENEAETTSNEEEVDTNDTENEDYSTGDLDGATPKTTDETVSTEKKTIVDKSETSSIERTILTDIVNGKKPARYYKLTSVTDKSKIFELFQVLQVLSDKAEGMTIKIEVQANTQNKFDPSWIRNAIEEPRIGNGYSSIYTFGIIRVKITLENEIKNSFYNRQIAFKTCSNITARARSIKFNSGKI